MLRTTKSQEEAFDQLQQELQSVGKTQTLPLARRAEVDDYLFTDVNGVTVLITKKRSNPRGGFIVPSLRTYPETGKPGETSLDAAIHARELFDKQSARDSERLTNKKIAGEAPDSYETGHFNAFVDTDWKCKGEVNGCPCNSEDRVGRKKRALHRVFKKRGIPA